MKLQKASTRKNDFRSNMITIVSTLPESDVRRQYRRLSKKKKTVASGLSSSRKGLTRKQQIRLELLTAHMTRKGF